MSAWHNSFRLKAETIEQLRALRSEGRVIQGYYWEEGRGCAIGCILESLRRATGRPLPAGHADYRAAARWIGIPQVILSIVDDIHDGLPAEDAQRWPEQFLTAIPVGADLSTVWPRFAAWQVIDLVPLTATPSLIRQIAEQYDRQADGHFVSRREWEVPAFMNQTAVAAASDIEAPAYTAAIAAATAGAVAAASSFPHLAYDADDAAGWLVGFASAASLALELAGVSDKKTVHRQQADKLLALIHASSGLALDATRVASIARLADMEPRVVCKWIEFAVERRLRSAEDLPLLSDRGIADWASWMEAQAESDRY